MSQDINEVRKEMTDLEKLKARGFLWAIDYSDGDSDKCQLLKASTREQARYTMTIFKRENPQLKNVRLRRL